MKRLIVLAVVFVMVFSVVASANEQVAQLNSINVKVNGARIDENNILYADRSYVPMRAVFEKIGCTVEWDQATSTATITGEIVKYDDADILKTYDEEYAAIKEQYDAYIAANAGNDAEIARLKSEFEALVEKLEEKYAQSVDSVGAPDTTVLPTYISVVDAKGNAVNAETNTIKVIANGTLIKAPNILYLDRTYIPLRAVAEELGCTVDWEDATSTAFITGDVKGTHEEIYTSYEEEYATLTARYEPMIAEKLATANKVWDEAYEQSWKATGKPELASKPYADDVAAPYFKEYETAKTAYEEKVAALKVKYGVKD